MIRVLSLGPHRPIFAMTAASAAAENFFVSRIELAQPGEQNRCLGYAA